MKKYLGLLLLILLQNCCWFGCNEDNPNQDEWQQGVQVSKQYLWKVVGDYSYTDGIIVVGEDLYYNNGYFSGSTPEKGKSYYEFRKIETGDLIWRLPNTVKNSSGYTQSIDMDYKNAHQYQHYVITEPYYPLCFNLKTGKTQWELKGVLDWSIKLAGFEDKYFFDREYAKDQYALYECNIITGKVQEVFKLVNKNPSLITSREPGGVIKPFRDDKGDILIVIPILDDYKNGDYRYYLGLYNYTKKRWVYQDIPINSKYGCSGIQLYKQKIFLMMSQGFACHRLDTGKEIWSTRAYNKFSNAGPWHEGAVWGNRLVVAMGDDHVMCLDMDADREHVLWRADGHGNGVGKFHMLNGIVYFADSKVHAIDVATGKYLWHLKSPDLKEYGSGAFFKNGLWVIPGKDGKKGRIITSTYRSGVCYEAIK